MKKKKQAFPRQLLHGGDYNPDQWLDRPDILEEDIRLMKKAHVNCVTLGVFSWAALEPSEGEFRFEWLEERIGQLYENGIAVILATPTGAMPMWLSAGHEEVHQMVESGARRIQGFRHNFCPSSPLMREKAWQIDTKLAQVFGNHPGVIAWHISNEYGGNHTDSTCHCPLCQENFRSWLKEKYGTLADLNRAWWTSFWGHSYTDWPQIHSPCQAGDSALHGLNLDWKRFNSAQMQDFMRREIEAVRQFSDKPVTTNYMGAFKPYDYFKWARELDLISIDSYPSWHCFGDDISVAQETSMGYDLMRSMKKQPFLLMESVPSTVNWMPVNPLKRPGMHELSSLQAIACGSNSVQYFQWRRGRGGPEKFHGAVIDHRNGGNTRVFSDVERLGRRLENLSERILETCNRPRVALIFDWENRWAFEDAIAWYNPKNCLEICEEYYKPFWNLGIDVDIVDMEDGLEGYGLVVAPVNYMYRGNYAERVRRYVEKGGVYVTTFLSGEVDETDLCFLGEHPLGDVLGIRVEETDAPGETIRNTVEYRATDYQVKGVRALVHAEDAEVLAVYGQDFYAGRPALTRNFYGKGAAYFIASHNEEGFLAAFMENLVKEAHLESGFQARLPYGVTVKERKRLEEAAENLTEKLGQENTRAENLAEKLGQENTRAENLAEKLGQENTQAENPGQTACRGSLFFLQNFNQTAVQVDLTRDYRNLETGEVYGSRIELEGYRCLILEEMPEGSIAGE